MSGVNRLALVELFVLLGLSIHDRDARSNNAVRVVTKGQIRMCACAPNVRCHLRVTLVSTRESTPRAKERHFLDNSGEHYVHIISPLSLSLETEILLY